MTSKSKRILELGEIIKTITPPKKIQTSEFLDRGDYPIIDQSPPNVAGWTNDETALVHPPKDGLIVFGDHTCVLKFQTKSFAQGADGIKIIEVKEDINPHYVYAHLKAFPLLNDGYKRHFSELKRLKILIPDSKSQDYISEIHRLIDSKIDSNFALSKTLEDIAQAIFKSWFIDFDPAKAKMAGEKPVGMDDETAALFPDSMKESELGLVPNGWVVSSLDEISEYLNGLAMQRFPVTDEKTQLPVIKIAQLRAGNTHGADVASGLLDSRFIIKDGDILFSWSGTLEVDTWTGGPGALNQHLFKVTGRKVPDWFSYLSTKHFLAFFREVARGKATTMGHIQRGHLSESKLAIPNLDLLNRVTEVIEPLISLKIKTSIESRVLAEIRDSLLPRLISGQLQIPEEMLAS